MVNLRNNVSIFFHSVVGAHTGPSKSSVAIGPSKAQQFLARLSRTKRNVWDRSRPDVQQWIMQFMYMGYDEQVSRICSGESRQQNSKRNQFNQFPIFVCKKKHKFCAETEEQNSTHRNIRFKQRKKNFEIVQLKVYK